MPVIALLVFLGLEVWAIIEVAGQIGVLPTIGALLLISIAGGWLLRYESSRAWRTFTAAVVTGDRPHRAAGDGALSVLGAVLLLIPGFISAFFGLLCLLPPTRAVLRGLAVRLLMGPARRRGFVATMPGAADAAPTPPIRVQATREHPVIDGELDK